jgi:hypothetical protein
MLRIWSLDYQVLPFWVTNLIFKRNSFMSACVHTDRYYPSHVQRHVHQMTRVVIVISSCFPPHVCSLQHCTSGCSARHIIFTYGRSSVQITTWRPLSVTEVSTVFFSPVTDVVSIHSKHITNLSFHIPSDSSATTTLRRLSHCQLH